MVLAAVKQNGRALKYADKEVLAAVKQEYASEDLKADKEVGSLR